MITSTSDLGDTIENFDSSMIVPFPKFDPSKFRGLLDEEMGFSEDITTRVIR